MVKRGFFFGELPPKTIHGVSLSNEINVYILKKVYDIDVIEEFSDIKYHNKLSINKLKNFLFPLFYCWRYFRSNNYDFYYGVIYLSSFGLLKNILLVIPFKICNPKAHIVLHFHRSDLETCLSNILNLAFFKTLDFFVNKYIVLSQKQVEEVKKHSANQILLLYNSIEEYVLKTESKIQVEPKTVKLLFLSNFIQQKGFYDLLEAQKRLNLLYPNLFELNCYGSFSNTSQKEFNIEELKKSNINIFYRVYGEKKKQVLNEADLVILPSYNEGLPLILLEALFVGKPIIISNVGYIEEILSKDYPFYCNAGDIDSIINSIIKFRENTDVKKLVPFLQNIYSRFSLKKHEEDLLRIFNQ